MKNMFSFLDVSFSSAKIQVFFLDFFVFKGIGKQTIDKLLRPKSIDVIPIVHK